jgi:outer membrane protein assembly factor BamD
MNKRSLLPFLFLLLLFPLIYGCGIIDHYFMKPPEDTAQELAEAGSDAMREKNYGKAIQFYTKLKDRYPFSPYTPTAELGLADAYFLDKQYQAAEENYKEFEALHPTHEAIPYVLFQIGRTNFEQFQAIDRPQEDVREALQYFTRVQEGYPEHEYGEKAGKYVTECRRRIAEHELFVADFYWRQKAYGSAWQRYSYVAENFTDLPLINQYAKRRSDLAYLQHQLSSSQKKRESDEGTWKRWFKWL